MIDIHSPIFYSIGQCGNKVGSTVIQQLDMNSKNKNYYSKETILIDSEPKVIKQLLSEKLWSETTHMFFDHGRGNNWAMSYAKYQSQKLKKEKIKVQEAKIGNKEFLLYNIKEFDVYAENNSLINNIMEFTRKKLEKRVSLPPFLVYFGLAGGTGSGLGSRLVEDLRDHFPMVELWAHVVFPLYNGETPLQNYNIGLSLSLLQENADCIFYNSN
jgi:Tubulin/FtsZ family, GTPase domain